MDLKKISSYIIKIVLLLVGIADFLGFLPSTLDILDKVLAAYVLFSFWLDLEPAKFIIGKKSKVLDIGILVAFYVLVLDTFAAFIPGLSFITERWISLVSLMGGLVLLVVLAFIFSRSSFKAPSVFHAVLGALRLERVERFWLSRFFAIFVVLLAVSQYLFGLINQWFIVSLDKSLLILAVLFAVKDIRHSKVKAFNTLGNFDEELLEKANQLFTHSKTIGLGVGFLLVAHVLSDVGVYAVPYLLGNTPEGYYLAKLGTDASFHQPLISLWSAELSKSPGLGLLYFMSGLGFLLLLLLPGLFCLGLLFKVDWKTWVGDKLKGWMLGLASVCVASSILAPWTVPKVIQKAGIYGADFPTFTVSSGMLFSLFTTALILGLIFLVSCFLSERGRAYGLGFFSWVGLAFLGFFAWTYLRSSVSYYGGAVRGLGWEGRLLIVFLILDVLFYVGAFIGFSRTVFRSLLKDLGEVWLDSRWLMGGSLAMVGLVMAGLWLLSKSPGVILTALSLFLITCALFHEVFFRSLHGRREFRDDFVLALNMVVLALLLAGVLSLLLSRFVTEKALNFFTPLLLIGVGWVLMRKFKLPLEGAKAKGRGWLLAAGIGVVFGAVFYLLKEPPLLLPSNKLLSILAMLFIALYEELFFRQVLFKLASLSYSFFKANALQSVLFAGLHFLLLRSVWEHYQSVVSMVAYFVGLLVFAGAMGWLVGKLVDPEKSVFSGSIGYAVLAHWIANIVLLWL